MSLSPPGLFSESIAVLKLVNDYGGGLSLSGPRIGRSVKYIAQGLIGSGHLAGTIKHLDITEKGLALLRQSHDEQR